MYISQKSFKKRIFMKYQNINLYRVTYLHPFVGNLYSEPRGLVMFTGDFQLDVVHPTLSVKINFNITKFY